MSRDVSLVSTIKFNRKIGGGAVQMALSWYDREFIRRGSIRDVSGGNSDWFLQRGGSCWWLRGATGRVGKSPSESVTQTPL